MVRSNPLFTRIHVAPLAAAMVLALGAGTVHASNATKVVAPAALVQPALVTPKALQGAMLAVGAAGTRLVAAGERGIVLYSDDAGKSWRQAAVPVSVSLTALQFVDGKNGWAVGHQGVVCLLYTSPSPRDRQKSRMPSSA